MMRMYAIRSRGSSFAMILRSGWQEDGPAEVEEFLEQPAGKCTAAAARFDMRVSVWSLHALPTTKPRDCLIDCDHDQTQHKERAEEHGAIDNDSGIAQRIDV